MSCRCRIISYDIALFCYHIVYDCYHTIYKEGFAVAGWRPREWLVVMTGQALGTSVRGKPKPYKNDCTAKGCAKAARLLIVEKRWIGCRYSVLVTSGGRCTLNAATSNSRSSIYGTSIAAEFIATVWVLVRSYMSLCPLMERWHWYPY